MTLLTGLTVNLVSKVNSVTHSYATTTLRQTRRLSEAAFVHVGAIVQLETLRFCRRFLTPDYREADEKFYDPKGRQHDQMTQAARSGRQNIIEGSECYSTPKDTEMKLTDVARAM